jgi:hypothetical protein
MRCWLIVMLSLVCILKADDSARTYTWKNQDGRSVQAEFRSYSVDRKTVTLFYLEQEREISWDKLSKESLEQARLMAHLVLRWCGRFPRIAAPRQESRKDRNMLHPS